MIDKTMMRNILLAGAGSLSLLSLPLQALEETPLVLPKETPAPLPPADTLITHFAFGSCADEEARQPIWKPILSEDPQLFLMIGDNVYADSNRGQRIRPGNANELHYSYTKLSENRDFTYFQHRVPMMVTWDDHDFGQNDAGEEFAAKDVAKDLMLGFFGLPQDKAVKDRDGVYHSAIFGPEGQRVQFIFLDTRWFRSPLKTVDPERPNRSPYAQNMDSNATMLGEDQWTWFEQQLNEPADLRFVISSIQVLAEGHQYEAWHTMPIERDRFYDTIERTGAKGVVLLSGDRHVAGLYRRAGMTDYALHEITSSSLNLSFARGPVTEVGPHQIGTLYGPENYGSIDIDWQAGLVNLSVKGGQGVAVRSLDIDFRQLGLN